jgi:integrase
MAADAEPVDLRWSQVNLKHARLHVRRVKNGARSVYPLKDDETRALRRLKRETDNTEYLFVSERGAACHCQFRQAGRARRTPAGFTFGLYSSCWHSCGYKLANDGHTARSLQAYLAHKNIKPFGTPRCHRHASKHRC